MWGSEDIDGKTPKIPPWLVVVILVALVAVAAYFLAGRYA